MRHQNEDLYSEIIEFIDDYKYRHYRSPSISEISARFGLSIATVSRYLKRMDALDLLSLDGYRNISTPLSNAAREQCVRVPNLGEISCGLPKFAEGVVDDYVPLPASLFGENVRDLFVLIASGRSMINAGIGDGDLVIVSKQETAEPGQIVAALVNDDEATLKRYFPDRKKNRVVLKPENPEFKDIVVDLSKDTLRIQGVVKKVLRDVV